MYKVKTAIWCHSLLNSGLFFFFCFVSATLFCQMLLRRNLFLHFRELHIQEQNKVSRFFINHSDSRKIPTTKCWSHGVAVV